MYLLSVYTLLHLSFYIYFVYLSFIDSRFVYTRKQINVGS